MHDNDTENPMGHRRAPDGGYGWIVLTSSFFVMFFMDGLFGSFGVLLPALMDGFGASPSRTSFAGSMIVGSLLLSALLAYPLIERFGCRSVAIVGSLVATIGLVLSSFAKNIWIFLVSYGVVTGTGIGLMYLPTFVIINRYFDKRRGITTSIMFCGSGFGVMVIAPVTEKLLEIYGWRGTILTLGGLCFQLCVACALFRPPYKFNSQKLYSGTIIEYVESQDDCPQTEVDTNFSKKQNGTTDSYSSNNTTNNQLIKLRSNSLNQTVEPNTFPGSTVLLDGGRSTSSLPRVSNKPDGEILYSFCSLSYTGSRTLKTSSKSIFSQKDILYSGSLKRLSQCEHISSRNAIPLNDNGRPYMYTSTDDVDNTGESEIDDTSHYTLLCNVAFWIVCIGAVLTQLSQFIPLLFLGDIGNGMGISNRQMSLVYSIFGLSNTIGRLLPGFIVDNTKVTATGLCTVGMVGCAVCCFLFPLCRTFPTVMTYGIMYGFFIAFFCPLQSIMVLDNVGLDNLTKGLSILTAVKAPAAIAGPPIAGLLYEKTQDYNITIIFTGGLCIATAIVYIVLPLYRYIHPVNNQRQVTEIKIETE